MSGSWDQTLLVWDVGEGTPQMTQSMSGKWGVKGLWGGVGLGGWGDYMS